MVTMKQARQITILFCVSMALTGCDKLLEFGERNVKPNPEKVAERAKMENARLQCKQAFARSSQSPNTIIFDGSRIVGTIVDVESEVFNTSGGFRYGFEASDRNGQYMVTCYTDNLGNTPDIQIAAKRADPYARRYDSSRY